MTPLYPLLIVLVLAWGAFAFGAVYDWAYVPLLWACAALGGIGLVMSRPEGLLHRVAGARPRGRSVNWPIASALALLAAATALPLIPLAPGTIAKISPAADRFLADYDVAYAAARATGAASYRHPLSIDPGGTRLGLACIGAFGLLMIGLASALGRGQQSTVVDPSRHSWSQSRSRPQSPLQPPPPTALRLPPPTRTNTTLRVFAAGLVVTGALLALTGIIQSGLGSRDLQHTGLVYGFWKPIYGTNPFGPFINRNHFAGWMLLALPVAIGYFCALVARGMRGVKPTFRDRVLWFSSPDASRAILAGLAVAVMGLSLVLTLSRSGISGFLLATAISAGFVLRRQVRGAKRAVTIGYLVLLVTFSLGWAGLDAVVQRFAQVQGSDFGGRLPIWSDAMRVVRDFPVTGTGLNTFGTAMLRYEPPDMATHTVEAHNDYLQFLAEGGALLAIPAVLAILALAREIRRRFREDADDTMTYWLRAGATTGLVAIALQEIVEFSLQMPGNAALFAVVAAIAIHRPRGAVSADDAFCTPRGAVSP